MIKLKRVSAHPRCANKGGSRHNGISSKREMTFKSEGFGPIREQKRGLTHLCLLNSKDNPLRLFLWSKS